MKILQIDQIILKDIPLQPTDNHLYVNYGDLRKKSVKHKHFKALFSKWALVNHRIIKEYRQIVQNWKNVKVVIILGLPYETLITKDGRMKAYDGQNRIKATLDCLGIHLGLDDRNFVNVEIEKTICDLENPVVNVVLRKNTLKSFQQTMQQWEGEAEISPPHC